MRPQIRQILVPLLCSAFLPLLGALQTAHALPNHPGAFVTQSELDTVRSRVASGLDPWGSAYDALMDTGPGLTYVANVSAAITDEYALQNQGHAAWHLALKWAISGDLRYAKACQSIIDAWVNTVTDMSACTTLRTGIGGSQMANAAELMAYGFQGAAGWPASNVAAAKAWFKNVPYKVISGGATMRSGNWGTSALVGAMAMAIFCDDQAMFDYAANAYRFGFTDTTDGYCGVTQYIDVLGENAEMGRDQGHSQGGIGHLMEVALMAWNQGVNLVPYNDAQNSVDVFGVSYGGTTTNGIGRLLPAHEYSAKWNLGFDVPYHAFNWNNKEVYYKEGISGHGAFSPIWEMAVHLFTKAGYTAPYALQAINSPGYAPEGTSGDHTGFGTLLYRAATGIPRPVVDSASASVKYSGLWTTYATTVDYQGSETLSSTAGDYAEWVFTGTQVQWLTRKGANMGKADVYIDGVLSTADVDCYDATGLAQTVAFNKTGLSNTAHTIKVVVKRTKNVSSSDYKVAIDVFKTDPEPPSVPAWPTDLTATTSETAPYLATTLNWTASETGATSYTIKRSTTTTGPYATIATGVTGTSYVDNSALKPGVLYYYVVSAVNAVGESIHSKEASTISGYVDDTSPTITYNAMDAILCNGSYRGTEHTRGVAGQYAQWTFTGTNVQWVTRLKPNGGLADVYIDGVLSAVNVDTYTPLAPTFAKIVYSISGLANGSHTIKVVVKEKRNPGATDEHVAIDAFAVGCVPTYPTAPLIQSVGGTVTATQGGTNQQGAQAVDNNFDTKWFSSVAAPWTLQYQFAGGATKVINHYQIVSANDVPERDPADWTLQGSNNGTTWIVLDTRSGEVFSGRQQTKGYTIPNTTAYAYYRLNISANKGGAAYGLQLAEFVLNTKISTERDADIGSVGFPGDATWTTNGTYSLAGSGADIWGTADAFHYAYQPFTGYGTIIARVVNQSTNSMGKTGVMFRESLAANSKHVDLVIHRTSAIKMEYRSIAGGISGNVGNHGGKAAPYWLKLVRVGNVFTGYMSPEGVTWTQAGQVTVPMNSAIYVGLVQGAGNNTVTATSTVDNVTLSTP